MYYIIHYSCSTTVRILPEFWKGKRCNIQKNIISTQNRGCTLTDFAMGRRPIAISFRVHPKNLDGQALEPREVCTVRFTCFVSIIWNLAPLFRMSREVDKKIVDQWPISAGLHEPERSTSIGQYHRALGLYQA